MIDLISFYQTLIFSAVYWGSLIAAGVFVAFGPDVDDNDKTLGGWCYNVLIRTILAAVALVVWYYAFTFIFFLFFETVGAL